MRIIIHALAIGTAIAATGRLPADDGRSATPGCLINANTGRVLVEKVQLLLLEGDSAEISRYGLLPVDTANVTLVTDDSVWRCCSSGV